jgi:hypothetical protein
VAGDLVRALISNCRITRLPRDRGHRHDRHRAVHGLTVTIACACRPLTRIWRLRFSNGGQCRRGASGRPDTVWSPAHTCRPSRHVRLRTHGEHRIHLAGQVGSVIFSAPPGGLFVVAKAKPISFFGGCRREIRDGLRSVLCRGSRKYCS